MATLVPIAHVITKLELGGAQQIALHTVSHLDRNRFRPILIAGEPGDCDREARSLDSVAFFQVPSLVRPIRPPSDLHALGALTLLFRRLKPTIVHTHSSKAGILGRWAARLAGVPIIVHTIHGFGFTRSQHPAIRRTLIRLERSTARFTRMFFAVSRATRRLGLELGLFSEANSTVLPPGIDPEPFRHARVDVPAMRSALGLQADRPVVGMIAPLKPQKAPVDFVRVAARVREARPDVQYLLVGDGELRAAVEREVSRRGLSRNFVLAGWRRDIAEIMRCLDVFVLTSLWEGLPRVYLEAVASDLPVVGTRVDGAPEVIRDGVNGYLAEPGDLDSLAERVLSLLADPDRARAMGKSGPPLSPEFDIREMMARQEREYETLLAELADQTFPLQAARSVSS
jgi:glycosyltransferase involved in cell wall biosynthesis